MKTAKTIEDTIFITAKGRAVAHKAGRNPFGIGAHDPLAREMGYDGTTEAVAAGCVRVAEVTIGSCGDIIVGIQIPDEGITAAQRKTIASLLHREADEIIIETSEYHDRRAYRGTHDLDAAVQAVVVE